MNMKEEKVSKRMVLVGHCPDMPYKYIILKNNYRTTAPTHYYYFEELLRYFPTNMYDIKVVECPNDLFFDLVLPF